MLKASKILVVDDSNVFREMLSTVLSARCEKVLSARNCAEGRRMVEETPDLDLVIADVVMPDASGFVLLEYVASLPRARRPDVILVTARPDPEAATMAERMGAAGYLGKPVSVPEVARLLRRRKAKRWNAARRVRRRSLGHAHLSDPRRLDSQLVWDIRDVSVTGAFLETTGPVPVGTELELALVFGPALARVRARVVRVQEPTWEDAGGVGVEFTEFYEGSRDLLEGYIAEADGSELC